jgi:enoyl-[acyl-carrier-protein] reductase (NADH)
VLLEADAGRLELIPELADRVARALGDDEAGLLACVHALADASVGPLVHPEAERALHPAQIGKTFEVMAHSFVVWAQALLERRLFAPGAQMLAMLNYLDTQTLRTAGAIGASKAALAAYVAYLGLELAPHGVRANAIRFGAADTEAASLLPRYDVILRNLASVSPMRRNVEVDDVGALVSLLLDPRAGFLNGAVIPFDGGELAAFGNLFAREMAR